jgi:hypothetical protein
LERIRESANVTVANVTVALPRGSKGLAADTAPPHEAVFDAIVQLVAVTVEASPAKTAPPHSAEFKVIVQSVAVAVESPCA